MCSIEILSHHRRPIPESISTHCCTTLSGASIVPACGTTSESQDDDTMDRQGHALTGLRRSGFTLVCVAALMVAGAPAMAASAFETPPPDPRAVTVKGKGDGRADDTDAIQSALDQAADSPGG